MEPDTTVSENTRVYATCFVVTAYVFTNLDANVSKIFLTILDNGSSINIFNDKNFFEKVGNSDAIRVNNSTGAYVLNTGGNVCGIGHSYFDPTIFVNIISYYFIVKRPHLFELVTVYDENDIECGYDVTIKSIRVTLSFREVNNVAIGSLLPLIQYIENMDNGAILVNVSESNDTYDVDGHFGVNVHWKHARASKSIKERVKLEKNVECVRRQQMRLGMVSDMHGSNLVKSYYSDMKDVDPAIFRNTTIAYGPDISMMAGKTIKITEKGYTPPQLSNPEEVYAEMDIMFANGYAELMALCFPSNLLISASLGVATKGFNSSAHVKSAIEKLIVKAKVDYKRSILFCFWDGERSVCSDPVQQHFKINHGCSIVTLPSGTHCKKMERKIRTAKHKMRSCVHKLLYIVPVTWTPSFIKATVVWCNIDYTEGNPGGMPPYVYVLGKSLLSDNYAIAHFGELCLSRAHGGLKHSSTSFTRSELWIYLHPATHNGLHRLLKFPSIVSNKRVETRKIQKVLVNMPLDIAATISTQAKKELSMVTEANLKVVDELTTYDVRKELLQLTGADKQEAMQNDLDMRIKGTHEMRQKAQQVQPHHDYPNEEAVLAQVGIQIEENDVSGGNIQSSLPSLMEPQLEELFEDEYYQHLFSQGEAAFQIGDMAFVNAARKEMIYQLALKVKNPHKAKHSMVRELTGMLQNDSFQLRKRSSLSEVQIKEALPMIGFTKESKSTEDGYKSRLVVDGSKQDRE